MSQLASKIIITLKMGNPGWKEQSKVAALLPGLWSFWKGLLPLSTCIEPTSSLPQGNQGWSEHTAKAPGINPSLGGSSAVLTPAGDLPGMWSFRPYKIIRSSCCALQRRALQRSTGTSCIQPISVGCPGCFFQKERILSLFKHPKWWLSQVSIAECSPQHDPPLL